MWYCSVYNQIASDVWRYNNPIYKLMRNKLQLVLINVLKSIFEQLSYYKVVSSVSTRLRWGKIFNDEFITQSPLSSRMKKQKIGQHLPKLWAIKYWVVVLWNKVYVQLPEDRFKWPLNRHHQSP